MEQVSEGVTGPLRAEHRELLPRVEALAAAADAVGSVPAAELRELTRAADEFLTSQLIPHARAEEAELYPAVDRLIGGSGETRATDTMRRDHVEVGRLAALLRRLREKLDAGELAPDEQRELRRLLYGLHAVVGLHFAKEEEVYLPLLDRELTAAEAQRLFERMEHAGGEHGAVAHSH